MNKMLYFQVIVFQMFTTICFRNDFSDFEGFLMPSIGRHTYKKVTATPIVHERLGSDSCGAEEIDYVNSAYREKENSSSKRYEMIKLSFGNVILVTD